MILKNSTLLITLMAVLCVVMYTSCTHDPFPVEDIDTDPADTTTNPQDTTMMGHPCDPDTVYFNNQILPILQSNCAFSGCHDAASASDDVVLEDYNSVINTAGVKPFDLNGSELYAVLLEDNPDKIMPPPPSNPLSPDQINTIALWILQGAEDLQCDGNEVECNTTDVSFSEFIKPTIDNFCLGCHSDGAPSAGISLQGYDNIKTYADNGQLYGSVAWLEGFVDMPLNQDKLENCTIDKIKAWIDDGSKNN